MPLRRSASVAEGAGLSQRLLRFKPSSGFGEEGGHWKDAWLVLHRDGILRWYNDHQCSRLLGESSVRNYPRRLKLGAAASEDGASVPPCPIDIPKAEEEGTILAIPGWSYSRPTVWFWLPDPATIRSWLHALSATIFKLRVYHLYLKQHEATGEPIQWDVLWQQILDFDRDDLGELSASRISLRDDFVLVDADGEPLSGAAEARPRRLRERKRRRRMRPSRSLSPGRAPGSATPNSNLSIAASAPLADIASTPTSHRSSTHSVHSSTHSIHSSTHSLHSAAHSGAGSRTQSPTPATRPLSIEVSADVHHSEYSPKSPSIATPASLGAHSAHSAVSGSLTEESFVRSPSGEVFLAKTNGEEEEEPPELLFQISLAEEEKKTAGNLYRESFKDENRPAVEVREERWTETVIPQQTGAPMSDSDMLAEVAAAMAGPKKVDTADSFADALGARPAQTREERGLSAILAETRAQQAAEVEEAHPEAEEEVVKEAPLEEAADGAELRAGIGAGVVVAETGKRDLRVLVAEDPAKQTLRSSRVFRYKRGRRLSGGGHWKEGWLVLHGDGNLAWYNDRQCSVLVGRTNLIEYPRRIKIGPQAAHSEDVKGTIPKPPGDDPNRLICIPAWTATGSPTWLYLRDDLDIEDWLGSFAQVLGKKSVYDRLLHEAKQAQPSPHHSRSHLPQKEEEEGKGKGLKWAILWDDVIDYGNETTMRRRKRRTKGAQRAPTPSRHSPERRSSRPHSRASSSAPAEVEDKPEAKTYESGLKEEEVLLNGQVETSKDEAPTVEDWEIVEASEAQPPEEHPIIHTTTSLLQTRGEEEEKKEKEKEEKDKAEEAEDMAALVSKVEKAQEETAARRSAFFASEDSTRTSSLSPPLDEPSENSSSMESLVLVDGVRLTKAEALRRRLEESREMAIRSKLPYPPLSLKLNGHVAESSETPGTPPSSPQPEDSDQPPPLPKSQAPTHLQQSEAEKTEHTTTTHVTIISTSTGESQDEAKTEGAVTTVPVETKHDETAPEEEEKMEKAEETSPASLEQHHSHSQPQSHQSEKVTVRTLDIATHPSTTTTTTTTTTTSAHVKEEKKAVEEKEKQKEEQPVVEVKVLGASAQIVEDKPKSAKPDSVTNSEKISTVKAEEQSPSSSPSTHKESTEHVESDSGNGIPEHHIVLVVKEQKHEEEKLAEPAKEAKPATAPIVKESTEHVPEEPKTRAERKEEKKVLGEKKGGAEEFRPIQAEVETRALDSDSESGQVGMQSTDAESEEEDREFIAKALAARRRSTPVKVTLPPSNEKEDSDGEEEEATTPRGGSPQPPQGPPQPQTQPPPPQPSQPVRPPPPSVRLTDYRRGPLERLTTATTTTTERHSVVVGSGEVEVRRVNLVQSSSGGGDETMAMSGRHASVEALAAAQTEHRVGELERVLSEARAELEKNQRLREALERERLRLRDAARQAQSQAYLQARQRQLQAIFDRAQQEAAALIHSDQSFNSLP